MVVLQSSGLLFSIGANGMLVMSKMPWPADAAAEPEWPGCSLVPDSHMQVSSCCPAATHKSDISRRTKLL